MRGAGEGTLSTPPAARLRKCVQAETLAFLFFRGLGGLWLLRERPLGRAVSQSTGPPLEGGRGRREGVPREAWGIQATGGASGGWGVAGEQRLVTKHRRAAGPPTEAGAE